MKTRTAIVGANGYTGGELLRLLLQHPSAEIVAAASRSLAGKPIHRAHPHLRGFTSLSFCPPTDMPEVDVLFLCLPHGVAADQIDKWRECASVVIDLSADFRLRSSEAYRTWYGSDHPEPALLAEAVYGLPEFERERLREATLISGVGCNATAMNLAMLPLARAGLIGRAIADIKVGSSEAGREPSAGSHHPERSRAMRAYAPAGHRHAAEVHQALGEFTLDVSVTAVEAVRGVLCTAHVIPTEPIEKKTLYGLYREAYADEPFVRVVAEKGGAYRLPDPKTLVGSNLADVGFEVDERTGRIVTFCAIDNLVKGAAGSAVQSMNIALGFDETAGLWAPGLHPA
ncbi:MAG: N-acetyl-gamma-glutamyl-phosphate reductase [Planctomycetota bacterium]